MIPQGTSIFKVPSIYIEMKAPSRHLQGTCRCSRYLQVPSGTSRYIQNEGTLKIKVPSMKKQYFSRYLESRYLRTKVHWGALRYFEVLIVPWGTLKRYVPWGTLRKYRFQVPSMYIKVPWINHPPRYLGNLEEFTSAVKVLWNID